MPVVKSYRAQQALAPLPNVQRTKLPIGRLEPALLTSSPNAASFGSQLGETVRAVGEQGFQQELSFQQQERLKAYRARLSSAENDLLGQTTSYMFDPETGVVNTVKGRAAIGLPTEALNQFDK